MQNSLTVSENSINWVLSFRLNIYPTYYLSDEVLSFRLCEFSVRKGRALEKSMMDFQTNRSTASEPLEKVANIFRVGDFSPIRRARARAGADRPHVHIGAPIGWAAGTSNRCVINANRFVNTSRYRLGGMGGHVARGHCAASRNGATLRTDF